MGQLSKLFTALGTVNEITVRVPDERTDEAREILRGIAGHVMILDERLSVFRSDSEVSLIGRAAGKDTVPVCEETFRLIADALEQCRSTGGAFDITSGPLTKLWKGRREGAELPAEEEIREAAFLTDYRDCILKTEPYRIGLRYGGQSLDLGSIAKGYAADLAERTLRENDMPDFLINFGGTLIIGASGERIGIRNPFSGNGPPVGFVELKNSAVVTSGTYENGFTRDGVRYHHLIDPQTGKPAQTGLAGVTLIGASAERLDVLTTMVFIKGVKNSLPVLNAENTDGIFIGENGEILTTSEIRKTFRTGEK